MKRTLSRIAAGLVLLAPGCAPSIAEKPGAAPAPALARVATVRPERGTIRRTSEQPGQIEAVEVTALHAKLAGYVSKVSADIGDRVKAGQTLAEIRVPEVAADAKQKRALVEQANAEKAQDEADVAVARAGVATAEARLVAIRAGVHRAEADVSRWKSEFTRIEQLFKERAQTGSLVDETRNKLRAAEATEEEAAAQVRSADAALVEARALLDRALANVRTAASKIEVARFESEHADAMESYSRVVAPYDGVVTRRTVERGQLTTPGTTGDPLFVLARSDVVTIAVGVPESDAAYVNAGDPARVRLPAMDGRTFEGKVARTSWALDPATRTLLAEVDLPNPEGLLRPGLYAYATIIAEEHPNALTVPASAVVRDGAKTFCVAVEGGKARRKPIRLGLGDGKRTEVLDGLRESDAVVEANAASLADGQPVETSAPKTKN